MSGSENTRNRITALDTVRERDKSMASMCVRRDVCAGSNAESMEYVARDLDALAARVAALEAHPFASKIAMPYAVQDETPGTYTRPLSQAETDAHVILTPAPAAPLVERMAEAMMLAAPGDPEDGRSEMRSVYLRDARAALRVAAEELLGPVTDEERAALGFGSVATTNRFAAVLRARLARAKEAARG